MLVLLWIHLLAKSSTSINEDHLRGFEGSPPRREPVQFHNPIAFDVGFDGETHESRPHEDANFCPNDPVWEKRYIDGARRNAGLHGDSESRAVDWPRIGSTHPEPLDIHCTGQLEHSVRRFERRDVDQL